jgi:hypothetical protein
MNKLLAVVVLAAGILAAPAHADPTMPPNPTRCKDTPGRLGTSSHTCQFPDGSIVSCVNGGVLPVAGDPCQPVYVQLAPGFWDQP